MTEPSQPTSNFECYENIACTINVGTYTPNYPCTFTYDVIDSSSGATSTLGFLIT